MSLRRGLLVVLGAWLAGALFYPFHGMIHFLLIVAIIMVIVDRAQR